MPADDKIWRNLKRVHVVFAVSCIGLLAVTLWMMAADHRDEWRDHADRTDRIRALKLSAAIAAEEAKDDRERISRIFQQVEDLGEPDVAEEVRNQFASYEEGDYVSKVRRLTAWAEERYFAQNADRPVTITVDGQEVETTVGELPEVIEDLSLKEDLLAREVRANRAERDKARADYDLSVDRGAPAGRQEELSRIFADWQARVERLELEHQQRETELNAARRELDEATEVHRALDEALAREVAEAERLKAAREKLDPEGLSAAKREIMQWPIIDGFNSPHKIDNIWLPDLKQTLGMAKTARYDRCRTCHQLIDQIETGNVPAYPHGIPESDDVRDWVENNTFPHPYATHPRPELYLTANSPHPVEKFGCTICHQGQGSATSFTHAAHGPNSPYEEEIWHHKYGYFHNHFWEYPMLPDRFEESGCLKCHHQVVELGVNPTYGTSAPKLYQGFQLIQEYGCFGCHEIHGYDAGRAIGPDLRLEPQTEAERVEAAADPSQFPGKMRKVGPSLEHIASKTTAEFVQYWTEEPKRFRPTTRMPQFFKLSNQIDWEDPEVVAALGKEAHLDLVKHSDPVAARYQPVELAGIAQYLFSKSTPQPDLPPRLQPEAIADYQPDPSNGKAVFAQRGCLACHSHEDFPDIKADFGPDLSRVHEKLKHGESGTLADLAAADGEEPNGFLWLYRWIQQPTLYHPRTKMPNLYLDPRDAADIAAYLLSKPARDFSPAPLSVYIGAEFDGEFTAAEAERLDLPLEGDAPRGARIVEVVTGSPATRHVRTSDGKPASLRVDDVILSFGGQTVENAAQLQSSIAASENGARVPLVVWRGKAELALSIEVADALDELVWLLLRKSQTDAQVAQALADEGRFDLAGTADIRGDEIELVYPGEVVAAFEDDATRLRVTLENGADPGAGSRLIWASGKNRNTAQDIASYNPQTGELRLDSQIPDAVAAGDRFVISGLITREMKLNYVGRRTIARYGCYGCHDIAGFETARPIGTTLQDWGRKDTSRLALEHIEEFLHHHGEPDGSSTRERAVEALEAAHAGGLEAGEFTTAEEAERELSVTYYLESLLHHGRNGFLWQKLRDPRSYDYKKVEQKGYEERLRMPRFTFALTQEENEAAIEAISTFILGLVAEPPPAQYLYRPQGPAAARLEGERLLEKFNCVGCHAFELPRTRYGITPETPGLPRGLDDLVGLTREDLVEWFALRSKPILKIASDPAARRNLASVAELPGEVRKILETPSEVLQRQGDAEAAAVRVVLENVATILDDVDLKDAAAAVAAGEADALRSRFAYLSDEEFQSLTENIGLWNEASLDLAEIADPDPEELARLRQPLEQQVADLRKAIDPLLNANGVRKWLLELATLADRQRNGVALAEWFAERPEVLIAGKLPSSSYPSALPLLLHLKPPRSVPTGERFLSERDFAQWLSLLVSTEEAMQDPVAADEQTTRRADVLFEQRDRLREMGVSIPRLRRLAQRLMEFDLDEELLFPEEENPDAAPVRRDLSDQFARYEDLMREVIGQPVVDFHGLVIQGENPDLLIFEQTYAYHQWETLEVGGRLILPGNQPVPPLRIVEQTGGRGGDFAHWLVDRLAAQRGSKAGGDRGKAWQMAPPPLYREGTKVQTPWLYNFLKNPYRIRYETVLRMPQFNLDDGEAQALANYFAAVDGVDYPYQQIPQREAPYLEHRGNLLAELEPHEEVRDDWLNEGWQVLNANICIKCHSVGTREFATNDPNAVRGPDLTGVPERLRPEWLLMWLYNPPRMIPYTSMPINFPRDQQQLPEHFDGRGLYQVQGVRDALLNYRGLMHETLAEAANGGGGVQQEPPANSTPSNPAEAPAEPNSPPREGE
ncbi:MAG: c-type cytochrome [Planctomycetes bacterium]|nr:c-type cytochrome [Planctomycetota bacterium]